MGKTIQSIVLRPAKVQFLVINLLFELPLLQSEGRGRPESTLKTLLPLPNSLFLNAPDVITANDVLFRTQL